MPHCSRCTGLGATMRSLVMLSPAVLMVVALTCAVLDQSASSPLTWDEDDVSTDGPLTAEDIDSERTSRDVHTVQENTNDKELKRRTAILTYDLRNFIKKFTDSSFGAKKPNKYSQYRGFGLENVDALTRGVGTVLTKCVRKFGRKCEDFLLGEEQEVHSRKKRSALKPIKRGDLTKFMALHKRYLAALSASPKSDLSLEPQQKKEQKEQLPLEEEKDESVKEYVFKELQSLLYKSRDELQDDSKNVQILDELETPIKTSPSTIRRDEDTFESIVPTEESRNVIPTPISVTPNRNSIYSKSSLLTKLVKGGSSDFSKRTASADPFQSTTQSDNSNRRHIRSTSLRSSPFAANQLFAPYRQPQLEAPVRKVTQRYGDYIVDYITSDYETTNPTLTIEQLLSYVPTAVEYEGEDLSHAGINEYQVSRDGLYHDDSDYPLYEYFVISEDAQDPSPYQAPKKQVFGEAHIPIHFVVDDQVNTVPSTRFVSSTPLSSSELYQIIKESPAESEVSSATLPYRTLGKRRPIKSSLASEMIAPSDFSKYYPKPQSFRSDLSDSLQPITMSVPEESAEVTEATPDPVATEIPIFKSQTQRSNPGQNQLFNTVNSPFNQLASQPQVEPPTSINSELTTTLQELMSVIRNGFSSPTTPEPQIETEKPVINEYPAQVTVTSDEIKVSGPDTATINGILQQLRGNGGVRAPAVAFVPPNLFDPLRQSELNPSQFTEVSSDFSKNEGKPSLNTLFAGSDPFSATSFSQTFQAVAEESLGGGSFSSSPKKPMKHNDPSVTFGIPNSVINKELMGVKSTTTKSSSHIFGIPKDVLEAEFSIEPSGESRGDNKRSSFRTPSKGNFIIPAPLSPISAADYQKPALYSAPLRTSTSNKEQLAQMLDSPVGISQRRPYNGIPYSVLEAELRTSVDEPEIYTYESPDIERSMYVTQQQAGSPYETKTYYVADESPVSPSSDAAAVEETRYQFFPSFISSLFSSPFKGRTV